MYDVRQFRPTLYVLLILGFSGFALASQSPGLWALAVLAVLFNAWLISRGMFYPLPRIVANLVTLAALLYIVIEVRLSGMAPILVIGQFLVLLQLVKLFEQRANRDYAQLLVLSLLLVVAASINTASLLFGILLIAYLFLSLYCCLLFHLKVESDHARAAISLSEEKINPASLRHDQQYLSRSMRKLTMFVSGTAIGMAILVFLFFPRGTGANLLAPLQQRAAQTLTGFSDNVSFQNIARISQNNEVVAHVRIWRRTLNDGQVAEKPIAGTQTIMLRGTTLNVYHGGDAGSASWQWERSIPEPQFDKGQVDIWDWFGDESNWPESFRQEIWLSPTGSSVLFALAGPIAVKPDRDQPRVRYFSAAADESLQFSDPLSQQTHYEVISRGNLDRGSAPNPRGRQDGEGRHLGIRGRGRGGAGGLERYGQSPSTLSPQQESGEPSRRTDEKLMAQFKAFASDPKVSGGNEDGPLLTQRGNVSRPTRFDPLIAANIAQYLRENYSYTLDITDVRKLGDGRDPLYAFLTDFKKGHCEYFAGAMALLCQSLGMDARVVVGFKCDEFNATPGANYYIVRQSHAHAWVEVRTPEGWETFDPTSSREAAPVQRAGLWQSLKHLMDYLEYTWANKVVAYDREEQGNVIKNAEQRLTNIGIRGSAVASDSKSWFKDKMKSWFTETNFFIVSSKLLSLLIYLAIFAMLGAIGGFFWERWKLRKRARRIGLENLSTSAQMRLARQLGFYDDLMQLLERYSIVRPRHLTPQEFSEAITFLPNEVYDRVRRLTQIYYRIRYGGHRISYSQRNRLTRIISHVGEVMDRRGTRT